MKKERRKRRVRSGEERKKGNVKIIKSYSYVFKLVIEAILRDALSPPAVQRVRCFVALANPFNSSATVNCEAMFSLPSPLPESRSELSSGVRA